MSARRIAGSALSARPPDLLAELTPGEDFALVQAESKTGLAWIHSHPRPIVVDELVDHDLIVEAYGLEDAERAKLVLWRVYSGCS